MSSGSPASIEISDIARTDATEVHARGRWLLVGRATCLLIALVAIVMWGWGVPLRYAQLSTICLTQPCGDQQPTPASIPQFAASGISLQFYGLYTGTVEVLFTLVFLLVAAVIFLRKSDTWIGMLTALLLVTYGVTQTDASALAAAVPAWSIPANVIRPLYFSCCSSFLFPNGRFVPSWTRIVALIWSPLFLLGTFLLSPDAIVVPLFASILVSLCAQVYRYRRVSTAAQRSQTKGVVFATAISFLGAIGLIAAGNLLPLAQEPGSLGYLIRNTGLYIFGSLIPLAIGVAILRAHLWDIDVLINKALVYGLLTALLGAVYIGLTIGLESLAAVITGHKQPQQIVIVISTLVIAALFQPFRRRIQQLIDRRFYRHKYNAAKTLASFSATLRQEVDLNKLQAHVLSIVTETMQPQHVSLWLYTQVYHPDERASDNLTPSVAVPTLLTRCFQRLPQPTVLYSDRRSKRDVEGATDNISRMIPHQPT